MPENESKWGETMKLAENIVTFRKNRGLTQAHLAEALNMTPAAVSKWETGAAVPDLDTLIALADYFRVSMDNLLGRTVRKIKVILLCTEQEVEKAIRRTLNKYGYQLLGMVHTIEELEMLFAQIEEQGEQADGLITAGIRITDAVRAKIMTLKSRNNRYMEWLGTESISEDQVEAWLGSLLDMD